MIYVYALPKELSADYCYPGFIPDNLQPLTWGNAPEEIGLYGVESGNDLEANRKALARHLLNMPYVSGFDNLLVIDTTGPYTMRFNKHEQI